MKLAMLGISLLLLLSSFGPWPFSLDLESADWRAREITVLTRRGPLSLQQESGYRIGIDHDLIQNFATITGFKIKWKVFSSDSEMLRAFANGQGDLIAGRVIPDLLTLRLPGQAFHRGPVFEESHFNLVCPQRLNVESTEDLNNKTILVNPNIKNLIQDEFTDSATAIFWIEKELPVLSALRLVQQGKMDCVVMETYEALVHLRRFTSLEIKMPITDEVTFGWVFRPQDYELQTALKTWMQISARNGQILNILSRYKAHLHNMNPAEFKRFWTLVNERLPDYVSDFKSAGEKYNVPWTLLAAVSYQESKWDPEAKSFTGVLGFMQITAATAEFLGLEDRLDVEASIDAGAKYLRYLIDQTPKYLPAKERLYLALAAWNIGPGHINDAQTLAEQKNLNPNSWGTLQKVLPLLADESITKNLKYGKARGHEPVEFVHRVRNYYDLLTLRSL